MRSLESAYSERVSFIRFIPTDLLLHLFSAVDNYRLSACYLYDVECQEEE